LVPVEGRVRREAPAVGLAGAAANAGVAAGAVLARLDPVELAVVPEESLAHELLFAGREAGGRGAGQTGPGGGEKGRERGERGGVGRVGFGGPGRAGSSGRASAVGGARGRRPYYATDRWRRPSRAGEPTGAGRARGPERS